jgi:acetyl esterase
VAILDATNMKRRPLGKTLYWASRTMMRLPSGLQRRLSGGAPIRRDGYELDAGLQLLLAAEGKIEGEWPADATRLRRERDQAAVTFRGPLPPVHAVRDLVVDGAAGPLRARLYSTAEPDAPLVYFHGGGFVFGNLETHDVGCRLLSSHGRMHVLSVEYRLVPEHRFPMAILDGQAAFGWAAHHAGELGVDASRIGIGGDSAGANVATVVSLLTRDDAVRPACQVLFYPPTDRARAHPSMNSLAEGFMLTRASVEWFHAQYAASVGADSADPRISPLLASDLGGLPRALVVTAGFDPLRDEGDAYAEALAAAGTPVIHRRFGALVHGFFNLTGIHDPSRDAVIEVAHVARVLFDLARTKQATRRAAE